MIKLCRFKIITTLTCLMMACALTGCSTFNVDRTDTRHVMLEVPAELLQPLQPLVTINSQEKQTL